jgi:hypothetical protein
MISGFYFGLSWESDGIHWIGLGTGMVSDALVQVMVGSKHIGGDPIW